jgi:hypothetical protein
MAMHDIRRLVILGVRRDNPGPNVRLLEHLSEGKGARGLLAKPDPEYRTRQNLGESLVHFVLKAKTVFSSRIFACGTSVHFCMATDHIVTV